MLGLWIFTVIVALVGAQDAFCDNGTKTQPVLAGCVVGEYGALDLLRLREVDEMYSRQSYRRNMCH